MIHDVGLLSSGKYLKLSVPHVDQIPPTLAFVQYRHLITFSWVLYISQGEKSSSDSHERQNFFTPLALVVDANFLFIVLGVDGVTPDVVDGVTHDVVDGVTPDVVDRVTPDVVGHSGLKQDW